MPCHCSTILIASQQIELRETPISQLDEELKENESRFPVIVRGQIHCWGQNGRPLKGPLSEYAFLLCHGLLVAPAPLLVADPPFTLFLELTAVTIKSPLILALLKRNISHYSFG